MGLDLRRTQSFFSSDSLYFRIGSWCLVFVHLWLFLFLSSCSTLHQWGFKGPKSSKNFFKPIWIKNHDPEYDTGNLPIGLQSPFVHEGIVYAGHGSGEMRAYELSNGRLVWRAKDNGAYHSGPVLMGDYITYGSVEGRVYARHRLNGELLWNVDLGAAIESKGVISRGRLYYHTRNHKIFCLDAKTGKILWAYKRSVPFIATLQRASRPLIDKNKLYVGFADGTVAAFSIEEGILLWENKIVSGPKFIDVDASPLIFNNQLIIGSLSGSLAVMDRENGFVKRKLKYNVSRKPLILDKRLFLGTVNGEIVVLGRNLKEVASRKISDAAISSMALWKGGLAISTVDGHLIYIDPKNLSIKSSIYLGHRSSAVFGELGVREGKLAAYSSRNRLYVFE